MKLSIKRICKELEISPMKLREIYYIRIQRDEAERVKAVRSLLAKNKRYLELEKSLRDYVTYEVRDGIKYFTSAHIGIADSRERYPLLKEKHQIMLSLGFLPEEDRAHPYCKKCHDQGKINHSGKITQCTCWKKGVKKMLLPYRSTMNELEDSIKFLDYFAR